MRNEYKNFEDDENFKYHKQIDYFCVKVQTIESGCRDLQGQENEVSILFGLTQLVSALKENSRLVWYLNLPEYERTDRLFGEIVSNPEIKNFKTSGNETRANGGDIFFLSLNPNSTSAPEYYPLDHEVVAKVVWGCVGKIDLDVDMSYDDKSDRFVLSFPTTGGLDKYSAKVLVANGQKGCFLSVYFDRTKDMSSRN